MNYHSELQVRILKGLKTASRIIRLFLFCRMNARICTHFLRNSIQRTGLFLAR